VWDGLLESFFDCPLKELGCKQQGGSCGFGVVDVSV